MTQAIVSSPGALVDRERLHTPIAAIPFAFKWGNGGGTFSLAKWTNDGNILTGTDKTAVSGDYAFDGRAGILSKSVAITAGDVYFNLKIDKERSFDCISILNHNWDDNDFFQKQVFQIKGSSGTWVTIYERTVYPDADWANANIHLWNFRGDDDRSDDTLGAGVCSNVLEFRIQFDARVSPTAASHAPAVGEIYIGTKYNPPFEPSFPWDGGSSDSSGYDFYQMNWQDGLVDRMEMHNGDVKNYIRYQGRGRREFNFTWHDGGPGELNRFWSYFWNGTNGGTYPFMWQDACYHSKKTDRLPMLMLLDDPAWVSPLSQFGTRRVEMAFSELPPFRQNSNLIVRGGGGGVDLPVWYNGTGTYT